MSYMRQVREPRFNLSSLAQYVMPFLAVANAALTLLIFGASTDSIWWLVLLICITSGILSYLYTRMEWGVVGIIIITVVSAVIMCVCAIPAAMFGFASLVGAYDMAPLPISLIAVNIPFGVFLIYTRYSLS